ncbi:MULTISPECIES: hypothetical protein [Chryseobacterium]|jgi:hypothetical protein|uniref:DUF4625 domain-containing protein n=1 Tax=Chryseobacterium balustinum TaxID=246 RepID=A0AAX2IK39_9FLAO|nr:MULTISPECIES: hypothetical protein [Chryseobacterium]AZB28012.1 hypothetical protein EB354_01300 [Chryseobacterium balustinum]MDY0932568.1 hypothetical protein [Chryseobacterium sp. CFBP8996]SKB55476.1 hypothetical protein SAMN05421800_103151 [Chryseobacterium balustinum]SQA89763.1 Uncharacterised protein [Chryseobacterium balustinum]
MKKFINITLVLFAALLVFSCRSDDDSIPEDVHEHDEIGKVVLKLTNKADAADVQTVSVISGEAVGHLHLTVGSTYLAELDFQIKHDDHYHSSDEIEEEKDHHFITFGPANADISVLRAANDIVRTDGQKLGLRTEWTINSTQPTGKMNIKLIHGPATVNQNYPSATNQLGQTTGGETDVDITVDAH